MKIDIRIICMGIVSLFILTGLSGCIEEPGIIRNKIIIPSVSATDYNNPKYAMASYYSSEEVVIDSNVPQYELPLDLDLIVNFKNITSSFNINDDQKNLLEYNGFFVKDYGYTNDIIQPYKNMKSMDIPIFVTSDTLLHLYHIQFDEILKGIEEREFFDKILDISKKLFDQSKKDYQTFTDEDLKEAARRNIAFFGVGLSLLQTAT